MSETPPGSNDRPCLTDPVRHAGREGRVSLPSSNGDLQLGN